MAGVSCARHSSSLFTTVAIFKVQRRGDGRAREGGGLAGGEVGERSRRGRQDAATSGGGQQAHIRSNFRVCSGIVSEFAMVSVGGAPAPRIFFPPRGRRTRAVSARRVQSRVLCNLTYSVQLFSQHQGVLQGASQLSPQVLQSRGLPP